MSASSRPANEALHRAQTAVNVVAEPSIRTTFPLTSSPSLRRREIRELRVALEERELHRVGRAVPVLGEDHLGEALAVRLLVVVLVPVDEGDEIGVLLDRSGLAQVGEDRPLVRALLDRARELRQRDDRDVEVAREDLQRAGDLRYLLHA